MGLQSRLNDVSSNSIPILLIYLIAACVSYLRSLLGHHHHHHHQPSSAQLEDGLTGSGLSGLVILSEQLNLNKLFSYKYTNKRSRSSSSSSSDDGDDCVVCLSTIREGDVVRKLDCCHVFHKECFDGWLDRLNFTCPLCRSPLVSPDRIDSTRRRVGGDLFTWFSSSI